MRKILIVLFLFMVSSIFCSANSGSTSSGGLTLDQALSLYPEWEGDLPYKYRVEEDEVDFDIVEIDGIIYIVVFEK